MKKRKKYKHEERIEAFENVAFIPPREKIWYRYWDNKRTQCYGSDLKLGNHIIHISKYSTSKDNDMINFSYGFTMIIYQLDGMKTLHYEEREMPWNIANGEEVALQLYYSKFR